MQFIETDEQRLIRESVRKLCSEFSDDYWEEKDRKTLFPSEFFDAMAEAVDILRALGDVCEDDVLIREALDFVLLQQGQDSVCTLEHGRYPRLFIT